MNRPIQWRRIVWNPEPRLIWQWFIFFYENEAIMIIQWAPNTFRLFETPFSLILLCCVPFHNNRLRFVECSSCACIPSLHGFYAAISNRNTDRYWQWSSIVKPPFDYAANRSCLGRKCFDLIRNLILFVVKMPSVVHITASDLWFYWSFIFFYFSRINRFGLWHTQPSS